jgi:hypothetical protein
MIIGLQSCKLGTTGTTTNENIPNSIKEEINELDAKVLKAITTKDIESLKEIMSDKLLAKSGNEINKLIEQISEVIKTTEYQIVDQFYIQNSTSGLGNTVMSGVSGIEDYIIQYQALNDEMFLSLILPKKGKDEFLITNIYGKYPDGWRLNILQFGQYTVNGKTAPQLYQQAQEEYDKGFLIDAANSIFLSSRVANPANKFWEYQKDSEMRGFYNKVVNEVKERHEFPMVLLEITSKPKIINIYPFGTSEGYFPMVEYLTKIDLTDTVRTKVENNTMHELIEDKFKGLTMNKKYVLYKAYSRMPDGKTEVPTYGFVKENK